MGINSSSFRMLRLLSLCCSCLGLFWKVFDVYKWGVLFSYVFWWERASSPWWSWRPMQHDIERSVEWWNSWVVVVPLIVVSLGLRIPHRTCSFKKRLHQEVWLSCCSGCAETVENLQKGLILVFRCVVNDWWRILRVSWRIISMWLRFPVMNVDMRAGD